MIVLTGRSAFKICQQLTEDSKNGEIQYVFTANSTPLLLYDALQSLGEENYQMIKASGNCSLESEFLNALHDCLEASEEEEVWKTITANKAAVQSLQSRLQSQLGQESTLSLPLLFYHVALDLHQ